MLKKYMHFVGSGHGRMTITLYGVQKAQELLRRRAFRPM